MTSGHWTPAEWKRRIRTWGQKLGFTRVGFAPAEEPRFSHLLDEWLARGYHGEMGWMARDPQARRIPQRILPEMKSCVVVLLQYYHPDPVPRQPEAPRISRYAWGDDYHEIMGEKLHALAARIRSARPETRLRVACDTSPVMDKAWAVAAGTGWLGKNTCVIHPALGSWFFLGEIFLDLELPPDPQVADHCGTCTRCFEACPTGALVAPYLLDARRCISYLNIEHRGELGELQAKGMGDWLVGCDICQEVCPWNREAAISLEPRLAPRPGLAELPLGDWCELDDAAYRQRVKGSAITRIKPAAMRRNARIVAANRRAPVDESASAISAHGPGSGEPHTGEPRSGCAHASRFGIAPDR